MPSVSAHAALADRNRACLRDLLNQGPIHPEWTVTVAFYVAVQRIESFLASKQQHCDGHKVRNAEVEKLDQLLYTFYRKLYDHSRYARYLANLREGTTYALIMPPQSIRDKVVDGWLATVERRLVELAAA